MEPITLPTPVLTSTDNSESYVRIELGKAGAVEITVKAGTDGELERLSLLKDNALGIFKSVYNDDVIKKHIKEPKA